MSCLPQRIIAAFYFPDVSFTVRCHIFNCANKVSPNFQMFSSLYFLDHSCKTPQIENEMKKKNCEK